ncbi:hypothetical protein [Tomitella gaofuii]|uniref:hypothetical protein n=1 Tax=Tomitella gaofuii TaxID=2760083 RepID=UPI0015FAD319|nr:hypothetical protein [Tomitella gaofuii]
MTEYWHVDQIPDGTPVVEYGTTERRFIFRNGRFDDGVHQLHAADVEFPLFHDTGDHP